MNKFEGIVKFVKEYQFWNSYSYRGDLVYIYKFTDENDKVYIWKTGTALILEEVKDNGDIDTIAVTLGSTIRIKANIKEENDYRGEHQIVLNRVKVLEILDLALTKKQKEEIRKADQIKSLKGNDFVYLMPYRQYKNHYSDCETLADSYDDVNHTIGVIIREGRLKGSGVRFQTFDTYRFENQDGKIQCRYAVSEENARRRVEKDYPNDVWTFKGISEKGWW